MYTIFGSSGFIGKELASHLKKNNQKVFKPNKNQIKFNKDLGYIIYCVGSDDWKNHQRGLEERRVRYHHVGQRHCSVAAYNGWCPQ